MRALGSAFKDDGRKAEKATNKRLVAKIKSGETLTADELAYCALNWSPVTHYYYLGRYAIARTKKARS